MRLLLKLSSGRSVASFVLALVLGGLAVAKPGEISDLAERELARRAAAAGEAQVLLGQGDEAYLAGRYEEAAEAYAGAVERLAANTPAVAEQRAVAIQRFSQASVEVAREKRRMGDVEGAAQALEGVLGEEVAPDDLPALAMQEQLLDPIRTNPAGSREHTSDVEEVRLLLYKADGAYHLGNYDQALAVYKDILQIDPYNKAARRGMERSIAEKQDYYRAAYDMTRAEFLEGVDAGWEVSVPPLTEFIADSEVVIDGGPPSIAYLNKLRDLELPTAVLEDVTLEEAIDYLRQQSLVLDAAELDPTRRGVNFVINASPRARSIRFSLNLRQVPLEAVLSYIASQTGTRYVEQPFAIEIRDANDSDQTLFVRTYRISPDFMSAGSAEAGGGIAAEPVDPFAAPANEGLLPKRLTAIEVLKSRGVTFPEGATAAFNASNSTLRVLNTAANHALIEQLVAMLADQEPTAVVIEVKVIKTEQKKLEELGFDWLIGDFGLGGNVFLNGGTVGNGSDVRVDTLGGAGERPVTAGIRSGDSAITQDSIDELILNASRGFAPLESRAPGVLGLRGMLGASGASMVIRGLDQKTGVDLNAVPSVVTRSGQQATLRIIREFIYPTEYEPPEIPNTVGSSSFIDFATGQIIENQAAVPITPAHPTSFEMRETGVILEVLPTVSADKRLVDLNVVPDITEFDGFVNYGSPILTTGGSTAIFDPVGGFSFFQSPLVEVTPNQILMPVFSRKRTATSVTIADNSTIVISGLLQEKIQNVEDKVPVLGDIPWVGRLFQNKAYQPVKTVVVFLVHVRVVDGGGRPFNP